MNSIVGPVNSAWTVYEQCMNNVFCPLHSKIMWFYCSRAGKKKKNWKCKTWMSLSAEAKRVLNDWFSNYNHINRIKLKIKLNKRQKYTKPIQFNETKRSKQIYSWKVVGRRIEKKNHMVSIHFELFDIYTLHIEEVDMNKKSNVSLICGSVKLK